MARKSVDVEEPKFTGRINLPAFEDAAKLVGEDRQVSVEEIHEILKQAIDKAARDTLYPNQKTNNAKDMHSETDIDPKTGEIFFYECKDVMNDDDIVDDLYQISVEDAQAVDPSLKAGDVYKNRIDLTKLDYSFFTRTQQNFMQLLREASKKALIDLYSNRVGQIIVGTVERNEGRYMTLQFGKIHATLYPMNAIPGEKFTIGDQVKVLLKSIGNPEDHSAKGATTLNISRTDPLFLQRLFEEEIPDVADGSVVIKGIVREPGNRAKVAVYSENPDVDPTGACIGSDGSRIKDICAQIGNEKIDVIRYQDNKYLYIAEALKPATVVGVLLKDDEAEEGKAPKAVAVVKNEESKIAIGKKGVNVRLASKITGYSIDIKELDAALAEHIPYQNVDDIRRKAALESLDEEIAAAKEEDVMHTDDEAILEGALHKEEQNTISAEPAVSEEKKAEEEKPAEEVKPAEVPSEEKKEEPVEEKKPEEPVKPAKKEEEIKHVEITGKAKISLDQLEAEIEEEKKNKNSQGSSYRRFKKEKKDDKKEEKKVIQNAMPIYTEEELKDMNEEQAEDTSASQNDDDYEEYDDDTYYEDK